jgi:phospholipid transport system substrate-binding protein
MSGWSSSLRRNYVTVSVVTFVLLVTATSAFAGPATETIKLTHATILQVLYDEELKKPERAADRKKQLAVIIHQRFSCTDMARHILGEQWTLLEQERRDSFVQLFELILLRTYLHHIERYADQYITYLGEEMESGRVLVRTKVTAREREVLLGFWMFERSGDWKIYDVVVDGVSLIENYRGQLARVLPRLAYADLLDRMRDNACNPDCGLATDLRPSR